MEEWKMGHIQEPADMMFANLGEQANADALLVHRGRFLTTRFMVEIGDEQWLVRVVDGRVAEVLQGPFVMPRWTFALRANASDWAAFWSPEPPPGYHDLFALIRFGRLVVEGDMHPFMANLFYFKGLLGKLRRTV
ncbi:hypothetical protein [Sphingopyxis terrae]|uniref:hypothetical protein n=1 Tax=Sphingopyxis terrae TaxID=33052 RepID=UPI002A16C82D|nr:hypothetical protein [Sphingopyxis terrae]MDX8356425.1 hypothetical protein [Sphingopyxis terrae]